MKKKKCFRFLSALFAVMILATCGSDYSKRKVQEEIKRYKYRMDRERTKYKVISEEVQEDGSVIMEIVREYGNNKPTGHYLE